MRPAASRAFTYNIWAIINLMRGNMKWYASCSIKRVHLEHNLKWNTLQYAVVCAQQHHPRSPRTLL
jgi:tellurite resistance-related uncharacterized protein